MNLRFSACLAVACGAVALSAVSPRTAPIAALSGCASAFSHSCTEMGCQSGVQVEFSYAAAGNYVFEVTVDGTKTTCAASLPLVESAASGCDRDGIYLGLVGSRLPVEQQSIGGLMLTTTTAKELSIRATKDGALLGESTVIVPYTTSPGPNGPDCEPKSCTFASYKFP